LQSGIDYKAPGLPEALAAACPSGIDIYFENVGGDVLEAVLPLLTPACRVPVCGWVSAYNTEANNVSRAEQTGTPLVRLAEHGLVESGTPSLGPEGKISAGGFRFFSFIELAPSQPEASEALTTMSGWIKEGKLKYRESITDGLDSAVSAFIGMLEGRNFGKTMVRVAE
jgi:NADPH-dependent curcumin reductase CurA